MSKTLPFCESKRVGIWIRVSTEEQAEGDSPEHHRIRAEMYAKSRGWQVMEIYDLAGVSGKSVAGHSEAQRMMADVKAWSYPGAHFFQACPPDTQR